MWCTVMVGGYVGIRFCSIVSMGARGRRAGMTIGSKA
jgi:hypothetical protein